MVQWGGFWSRQYACKWLAVFLWVTWVGAADADVGKRIQLKNAKWLEECGSCHVAYPPYLLDAGDWQIMMGNLSRHYGSNAELPASERREILAFLKKYAGDGKRFSSPSQRITETPWFRREHRNISPKEWLHPQVKSKANCEACHIDVGRNIRWERELLLRNGQHEDADDDHERDDEPRRRRKGED